MKLASVEWTDTLIDLGSIPLNKPVGFSFPYKNVGKRPLIISRAEPTCGCTVLEGAIDRPCLPQRKDSLKGILKLPGNKEGIFVKSIYVMLNTTSGFQVLRLKGTAYVPHS